MPSTSTDRLAGVSTSVAVKAPCVAAATSNVTLFGEQSINGIACVEGDRVLLPVQSNAVESGIYVVSTSAWTRAKDFNGARDAVRGTIVLVSPGTSGALWYELTTENPVIGVTPLTFQTRNPADSYSIHDPFVGDGTTTVFTLTSQPGSAVNTRVVVDGITLTPSRDYNVSGNVLTFAVAPPKPSPATPTEPNISVVSGTAYASPSDATSIAYTQGGVGAVERTVADRLRTKILLSDYVSADGSTETIQLQKAIDAAKTLGAKLEIDLVGVVKTSGVRIDGGTKPWAMVGHDPAALTFEHVDGNGTIFLGTLGSSVPYTLEGFTVDAKWAEYAHVNANSCISIGYSHGIRLRRIVTKNFKDNGILIFDDTNTGATYDNWGEDCHAFGDGVVSGNGVLMVNSINSGWVRCSATDCPGVPGTTPGIGVQLKNDCENGSIVDCWAKNCRTSIGFGNDASPAVGMVNSHVIGGRSYGCEAAFLGIEMFNCSIHMSHIDMESFAGHSITCDGANSGNTYKVDVAQNLNASKAVFRFTDTCNGNTAWVGVAKDRNSTGYIAEFSGTATNNHVKFGALVGPANHPNGFRSLAGWNSTTGNSLSSDSLAAVYRETIASGAITIRNAAAAVVEVDTESAAATDDLATISAGSYDGQLIRLRTLANSRDVVLKHNTGNILLDGAADFTLDAVADSVTLEWKSSITKWCETARSNNS